MSNNILALNYKTILGVALPMMVSGFIQSIVLITDTAFISRYSIEAFDAVGNGGLAYITFYIMMTGLSDGTQIIMARRIGEDKPNKVGRLLHSAWLLLAFVGVILFCLLYFLIPDWISQYSKNGSIAILQGEYIHNRSYALFICIISLGLQSYYLARGKTWVVLISAAIIAVTNILLDYLLIFGIGIFPEMGVSGAAIASTLAEVVGMGFLITFTLFSKDHLQFRILSKSKNLWIEIKEIIKVGYPLMLQGFAALATWTLFFTWIEQRGAFELTVSQNIRSIYFLAFVPIWGFAGTTRTYISQYIGAQMQSEIPKIQKKIQIMTILFMAVIFHGALLYPETLISWINPDEKYIETSAQILRLVAGSIMLYALVSVYFQTIHGSGNTLASMTIEFVSVGIYSLTAYLFIHVWQLSILQIWTVEYLYFGIMGAFSYLYLRNFSWDQKKI